MRTFHFTAHMKTAAAAAATAVALAAGCGSSEPPDPVVVGTTSTVVAATTAVPAATTAAAVAAAEPSAEETASGLETEDPLAEELLTGKVLVSTFEIEEALSLELHPCDETDESADGICEHEGETLCSYETGWEPCPSPEVLTIEEALSLELHPCDETEVDGICEHEGETLCLGYDGRRNVWEPCPGGHTGGDCDLNDDSSAATVWSGTAHTVQTGQSVTLTPGLWRIGLCVARNDRLTGAPSAVSFTMNPLIDGKSIPHPDGAGGYILGLYLVEEYDVVHRSWSFVVEVTDAVPHPGGWETDFIFGEGDDTYTIVTAFHDAGISAGEYELFTGVNGDWVISVTKIR